MSARDETIIRTSNVSVRILTLAPGEVAPWHFHTEVVDNMFCLSGKVVVDLRDPVGQSVLQPGQRLEVGPGRVHRVANPADVSATYLLVQGVGKYDFNVVD